MSFPSWYSTTFPKIVVEVMTGSVTVRKLWLRVSKGMLPVKHPAPKSLKSTAVNHSGRQVTLRLGWAAPAYHKKEGATPHSGSCKYSLQYDRRPDECFGVWVGMWNLGSVSGKRKKFVKN